MTVSQRASRLIFRLFSNWPAKALALGAAILLYLLVGLDSLEERYITVPVRLDLPPTLVPAAEYPNFARVYLRGRGSDIFSISEDDIQVSADFSSYSQEGVFQASLTHRRLGVAETIEPLEVRVEPGLITLTLEDRVSATVPVIPILSGSPAPGFELSSYSVIPSEIRIYGPRSAVQRVNELNTESIELSGQDEDFSVRVSVLQSDPLIRFEDARLVEFRGEISDSILVNTFENVPVVILGLDPAFSAVPAEREGSIRAQASQSLINQTDPESISLAIDASDISEPGRYLLPVRPVVPRGFVIFRFDPLEIEVDIIGGGLE
jgi:YbbR domain-containing protein